MQMKKFEIVSSVKILGVTFTQNMLWDVHIESVLGKLSRVVGMMARHRLILPFKIKLLVYNELSFFLPCIIVFWYGARRHIPILKDFIYCRKKFDEHLVNVLYNSHTSDLFLKGNIIRVSFTVIS